MPEGEEPFAKVVHVIADRYNVVTKHGATFEFGMSYKEAVKTASAMNQARGSKEEPHTHQLPNGMLASCFHKCRSSLFSWQFWAGLTFGFPFEHFIWEKLWPFKLLTHWLRL
jgi:hypothetical protein